MFYKCYMHGDVKTFNAILEFSPKKKNCVSIKNICLYRDNAFMSYILNNLSLLYT